MIHENSSRSLSPAGATLFLILACAWGSGCASWRTAERYDGWTLYERPNETISVEAYRAAFEPAFEVVERALGPFEGHVRVHAWHGAVGIDGEERDPLHGGGEAGVQHIPGIGPARVQAYHARGGSALFSPSGVFIGVPEVGTAVHELVHARLAEENAGLPLWFEEGLASLLGDGFADGRRWVVDGLAYWPLRELREERLSDAEIERLLRMRASDRASVRDNVLVHFLGWAIVFDLYRETESLDWRELFDRFDHDHPVADTRRRLERTLDPRTSHKWWKKLQHEDPGVRLACAKGLWKLRSRPALQALLSALSREEDDEVRLGLAVNALAAQGEIRMPWAAVWTAQRSALLALRDAQVPDPDERRAAIDLYRAHQFGGASGRAQNALDALARFWRE